MNPSRTAFAAAAMDLAKLFELFVGATPIAASAGHPYAVALTEPHGPSTGGGKQRLQHITFTRGNRTVTVGSIDNVERICEIRGFAQLNTEHQDRWNEPLYIAPAEFEGFLKRLRAFAGGQQITVVIKELAAPRPAAAIEPSGPSWPAWLIVILLLGGLAGVIIYVVVTR